MMVETGKEGIRKANGRHPASALMDMQTRKCLT
jgi:hypothetical protein